MPLLSPADLLKVLMLVQELVRAIALIANLSQEASEP